MNDRPVQTLSYAVSTPRRGRFRCLWVMVPFMLGCVAGALLLGWIVCCGLGGYILGVADFPSSPQVAFGMWTFWVVLVSPVLFAVVLAELVLLAVAGREPRRWWVAALIGLACPCLPMALGIRAVVVSYPEWEHVRINEGALIFIPVLMILAPLLLVRRPRAVEQDK